MRSWSRSSSGPRGRGSTPRGEIVQVVDEGFGPVRRQGTIEEDRAQGYVKDRRHYVLRPALRRRSRGRRGRSRGTRSQSRSPAIRPPTAPGEGGHHRGLRTAGASRRSRPIAIIRSLGIPDVFDDDTLDEARRLAKGFNEEDVEGRLGPPRATDDHHRPGHGPRLRRRHHLDPRRERLLDPRRPHRRRLALRQARLAARQHGARSAGRASTCPIG